MGGVKADSPTADFAGIIQFSYSTWPVVFTVVKNVSYPPSSSVSGDLNGDDVVDEKEFLIVYQHMGNVSSYPYPNYDVNKDKIVDVLDMRFVTGKISVSLIEQVHNFLKSLY